MNNKTITEANESIETVAQNCELTEKPKNDTLKRVGIGLCLTTVGLGVATLLVVKNKERICNLLVKVLEKNDYIVTKSHRVSADDTEALGEEWRKQCSLGEDISDSIFEKKD